MKLTHQVDIWTQFMHIVLIVFIFALCVLSLVIDWRCQGERNSDVTINITSLCRYEILNGRTSPSNLNSVMFRKQCVSVIQWTACIAVSPWQIARWYHLLCPKFSQKFCRFGVYFALRTVCLYAFPDLTFFLSLEKIHKILYILRFGESV